MKEFVIDLRNTNNKPVFNVYSSKLAELIDLATHFPFIDYQLIILGGIFIGGPVQFQFLNMLLHDRTTHITYDVFDSHNNVLYSGNELPANIKSIVVSMI